MPHFRAAPAMLHGEDDDLIDLRLRLRQVDSGKAHRGRLTRATTCSQVRTLVGSDS